MKKHIPVLLSEALSALHVEKTRRYIDATLGAGGHSAAILAQGGSVLGIEADQEMIEIARARLRLVGESFEIVQGNFVSIDRIARTHGYTRVDGILYDLGISSFHYENGRGFSFENENEPLDMRLDIKSQAVTAADLLNSLREDQMEEVLGQAMRFGEAKRVAKLIRKFGKRQKYEKVGDLLDALVSMPKVGKLHPATKVFAALRIAVNSELENLKESLPKALGLLEQGGAMVIISFHSGEDRIVKQAFTKWETERKGVRVTKKPIRPGEGELRRNPRARSAKMRVFERKQITK